MDLHAGGSGTEEHELFDGETATLTCGHGWHVGHAWSARAVEQLQICFDYQQLSRSLVVLRHGNGICGELVSDDYNSPLTTITIPHFEGVRGST